MRLFIGEQVLLVLRLQGGANARQSVIAAEVRHAGEDLAAPVDCLAHPARSYIDALAITEEFVYTHTSLNLVLDR